MLLYGNTSDMNGVDIYADINPKGRRYAPIWSRFESMCSPHSMPTPLIPYVDRKDYCQKLEELNKVIAELHEKRSRSISQWGLCCFHYNKMRDAKDTLEVESKRIFKSWRRKGVDVYLLPGSIKPMQTRYKAVTDVPNRLRISVPEEDSPQHDERRRW